MSVAVGSFTVQRVVAGAFALDGGAMFGVVPRSLWQRHLVPDDKNRVPLRATCLFLEGLGRRILIDTGMGTRWSEKTADLYAIDPSRSSVAAAMEGMKLHPDSITDVVLTHLHFDHAGGAFDKSRGALTLAFPEATHFVQERHWRWAQSPSPRDVGSFIGEAERKCLLDSGRLKFLDGETELLPGLTLLVTEGHTPGLQLPLVSGHRGLFFAGDLVPTRAHLKLSWGMAYDLSPLVLLDEKRALLERAARQSWVVAFGHDPNIAACTVRMEMGDFVVGEEVVL